MRILLLTILASATLTSFTTRQSNAWRGIRPLYSTRADVERTLGLPTHSGGVSIYRPFDQYGDIDRLQQEARLDNFALSLENDRASNGFVIVYAGGRFRAGEALAYGNDSKKYLVGKRKIDQRRIIVINGGYRQNLETELYIVPKNSPAPTPSPTLSTDQVKVIKKH
ncbi:MAG TPA: hypothetical protein DC054_06580 [Blastocatellia bacterium]|nr:hypothetical protein [Blastocatellia bacterium]